MARSPVRSLVPSKIKEDENAECTAIRAVSLLKLVDGCLCLPDDLHDFRSYEVFYGIVVGEMALALHLHDLVCEILNFRWKLLKDTL